MKLQIETPRLTLMPFAENDATEAFDCITPTLTRYMAWEAPANRAAFADVWQAWLVSHAEGAEFVFAIRERQGNQFVGLVGLHGVKTETPELGLWIREDRHGNGFGREAVTQLALWASQTLKPAGFIYPVAEENVRSRRIAESLGGVIAEHRTTPKYRSVVYSIPLQTG